jgi:hypothetical protein
MYVFEKWGLLVDEGRGRSFCVRATFVAPSELLYDWRFIANEFVLAPSLLRLMT